MVDRWYYGQDNRKLGPFSAQELRALADEGRIQAMDTIWKEGVEQGVMAHRVKNLFEPPPAGGFPGVEGERVVIAPVPEPSATVVPAEAVPVPPPIASLLQQDDPGVRTEALPPTLPRPEESGGAPEPSTSLHTAAEAAPSEGQNVPLATGEASPQEEPVPPAAPKPPALKVQTKPKGRAISAKGAILMSQNGVTVQFQTKCTECGYLDPSKSTMPIRAGTSRTTFFCRKCRKLRHVEIQGIV